MMAVKGRSWKDKVYFCVCIADLRPPFSILLFSLESIWLYMALVTVATLGNLTLGSRTA